MNKKPEDLMVQLKDGKSVPATKRVFALQQSNSNSSLLRSASGSMYRRDATGALINIDPRPLSKRARAKLKRQIKKETNNEISKGT